MFQRKTWRDRESEYPNRRQLVHADGTDELVSVLRAEGDVSVEGEEWNAANMNDLEGRIENALTEYLDISLPYSGWTQYTTGIWRQTVYNNRFLAAAAPEMYSVVNNLSAAAQKAYIKAYAIVSQGYAVTANGSCTFYCYKQPMTSITVRLKGV